MLVNLKKYFKKFKWVKTLNIFRIRVRWLLSDYRSAFLSRATELKMTPYGFKLKGINSIHHIGMQEGKFEVDEVKLFLRVFEKSDVFVDVGANIGFYSCLARQANKYVVAIEPLQKNLKYLYENVKANKWDKVEIFPLGLSHHPGVATLYGGSSTGASLIGSWAGASKIFKNNIALSTLDFLLGERFCDKKLFIKIDVEGAEYQVLLGARHTMASHPKPTWVLEICYNEYHPEGVNPDYQKIFNLFWENGYECHTADSENKLITQEDVKEWIKNRVCKSGTINYIFEEKINLL